MSKIYTILSVPLLYVECILSICIFVFISRETVEKQQATKKAELKKLDIIVAPGISRIKRMDSILRRNFDEADSLLQILSERKIPLEQQVQNTKPITDFCIRPRNDADIIEGIYNV